MVSAVALVIAAAIIGANAEHRAPSREDRPERARRRMSHEVVDDEDDDDDDDHETGGPCTTSFTTSTYDSIVMDIASLIDGASDDAAGSHVRKIRRDFSCIETPPHVA